MHTCSPPPIARVSEKVLERDRAKRGRGYREEVVGGPEMGVRHARGAAPEGVRSSKLCSNALDFSLTPKRHPHPTPATSLDGKWTKER